MNRFAHILRPSFALAILVTFVGCAGKTHVRSLATDLILPEDRLSPRACALEVAPVEDRRPPAERFGEDDVHFRVFLPIVPLLHFDERDVVDYSDPDNVRGARALEDLRSALEQTLAERGPCAGRGLEFVLRTEIIHLTGANAAYASLVFTYGAFGENDKQFYPAGSAALRFRIEDAEGRVVDVWSSAGRALYDAYGRGDTRYLGRSPTAREDGRNQALIEALSEVVERLPGQVDRALATAAPRAPARDVVRIERTHEDPRLVARAEIDARSGEVLHSWVERAEGPTEAGVGVWTVSRRQPVWLARRDYVAFVQDLADRFVVELAPHERAARFYGLRSAHP